MSPLRQVAAVVVDIDIPTGGDVYHATPEWEALLEWCRFHHLDPKRIPSGSAICRVASARLITYTEFALDDDGNIRLDSDGRPVVVERTEQGESPPLPFPDNVAALLTRGRRE